MARWIPLVCILLIVAYLALGGGPDGTPPLPQPAPPADAGGEEARTAGPLRVRIEGADPAAGHVALALFGSAEDFASETSMRTARLAPGTAIWLVQGLERGTYAVKAFHDRDDNGTLNKGAFGAPSEPYGFSNNARGTFGPPSFDAASFTYDGTPATITIRVR